MRSNKCLTHKSDTEFSENNVNVRKMLVYTPGLNSLN